MSFSQSRSPSKHLSLLNHLLTMEFPHLGQHCSEISCNKLDFLPVKCDACKDIFCHDHMSYFKHNCPKANAKNVQVPVCPLCNEPVPTKRGEMPDIGVSAHIDRECQSDPAISRRKVYNNKCNRKGCKKKELLPMICKDCRLNFCITHRHPTDHNCTKTKPVPPSKGSTRRSSSSNSHVTAVQGHMSEDEALARALALSLEESKHPSNSHRYDNGIRVPTSVAEFSTRLTDQQRNPTNPHSCSIC